MRSRVTSCGDKYSVSGTVKVKIKIGANGRVRGTRVRGASGSGASCISSAIKRARFKKSQNGMTVTYPFVFR